MAAGDQTLKTLAEWSFQSGSYAPTGNNDLSSGSPSVVGFSLAAGGGIAVDAAKNSDKVDLGANRPGVINVKAAVEWFSAINAGGMVQFFWSMSANSAAAAGNPGRPSGTDGVYTGDGGGTVDQSVVQMQHIGNLRTTSLQGVQIAYIGSFVPLEQYGQLVVVNKSSAIVCATNDIQSSVLFYGTIANVE